MKRIAILGSTGSIGTSTLKIVEAYPDLFTVVSLAGGHNLDLLAEQTLRWHPKIVSVATQEAAATLKQRLAQTGAKGIKVVFGTDGTVEAATLDEVDFVVSAIVGVGGLKATYEAVKAGKWIGLANKETMVAAGEIVTAEARKQGKPILPIDSEHNAIHQAMRGGRLHEVEKVWLTASGGPFLHTPIDQFEHITVEQALNHPTWKMGRRITIDSATLMNKGFEVIEACRLFAMPPSKVEVIVHPQSTIHSMVEFTDGSILAQLSVTDMRLPILYAMTYPDRVPSNLKFPVLELKQLDFYPPDFAKFPCLPLAYEAAEKGGTKSIALNAVDEVAVAAFLEGGIPFNEIPRTIGRIIEETPLRHPESIEEVLLADEAARDAARRRIQELRSNSQENLARSRS
ncbi:MAG TPA: 1-deoxy-D-xylulose-5-phosphate reductoisomerase [Candidatus Koribacter sp.]|jgi:1-deoxy-D-xylulose-5-phosphate reductoisomerase